MLISSKGGTGMKTTDSVIAKKGLELGVSHSSRAKERCLCSGWMRLSASSVVSALWNARTETV